MTAVAGAHCRRGALGAGGPTGQPCAGRALGLHLSPRATVPAQAHTAGSTLQSGNHVGAPVPPEREPRVHTRTCNAVPTLRTSEAPARSGRGARCHAHRGSWARCVQSWEGRVRAWADSASRTSCSDTCCLQRPPPLTPCLLPADNVLSAPPLMRDTCIGLVFSKRKEEIQRGFSLSRE